MKKPLSYYIGIMIFAVGLTSCGTANLKEGERLYTGADIIIDSDTLSKKDKNQLKDGLEGKITPKPNTSFLGMRPKLFIGNLMGDVEKKKGIRHWIKQKLGEEPVLLNQVDEDFNRDIIVNYSENKGYFNAQASYETKLKDKTAKVEYTVKPKNRYYIRNVAFDLDSSTLGQEIAKLTDKTILRSGDPFDLDVIKTERQRIDTRLK
ncbi:MAG: BamA/TamA family outer membrane protein, partial [Weeksellaceae bacterium]